RRRAGRDAPRRGAGARLGAVGARARAARDPIHDHAVPHAAHHPGGKPIVIVGVLLAAGASTRMGSPKALVRLGGQSFLVRGVRALWSVCDTVIVVLGADGQRVCRAVNEEFAALVEKGLAAPDLSGGPKQRSGELEVRFAFNKRWPDGMLSSARLGLAQALRHKPRGVLLLPVDHPEVKPAT